MQAPHCIKLWWLEHPFIYLLIFSGCLSHLNLLDQNWWFIHSASLLVPGRLWSFEVTGDDVEQHERDESLIQSAGSLSESLISPPRWLYNLTPSFRCRGERIRTGPRSSTSSTQAARTLRSLACPTSPSSWFTLLIRWEGMRGSMAIPCSLALTIPMMSGIWVQQVEQESIGSALWHTQWKRLYCTLWHIIVNRKIGIENSLSVGC